MVENKTNEYEYREFPKWVTPEGGSPVIVNDEEEELQVMVTNFPPVREVDERARLVKVAEINSVQIDKRWNLDKIAAAIEVAGFDPQANPFE